MTPIEPIKPHYKLVSLCYACSDSYASYLAVSLYSLLRNADPSGLYDILILHRNIVPSNRVMLRRIAREYPNVKLRFVNLNKYDTVLRSRLGAYYTIETNYRLFLLSELFSSYRRMIYLDTDTVVNGDIAQLFSTPLEGCALGAAPDVGVQILKHSRRAVFSGETPYNITDYVQKVLGLPGTEGYFNAGVLLLDLDACRRLVTFEQVCRTLHSRLLYFNDQDVLNILFHDHVKLLDVSWNYTNNIALQRKDPERQAIVQPYLRDTCSIVHYISANKPWNAEVPLGELYHEYLKQKDAIENGEKKS